MSVLKQFLDGSFRIFDAATLKGFYFLPFLAASLYLLISEDEQHKRFNRRMLVPCAVGFVLLMSPLFGRMAMSHSTDQMTRFYWTIPFSVVVIYCFVEILYCIRRPITKVVVLCVAVLGLMCFSRQDNLTAPKVGQGWPYVKAENLYKLPNEVYEVCNIIRDQQNGEECYAVMPHALAMNARQYDASILMPYGSYRREESDIFQTINADEINLNDVAQLAQTENWDYIVLEQEKITGGKLPDYAELATVPCGEITYVIYQRR